MRLSQALTDRKFVNMVSAGFRVISDMHGGLGLSLNMRTHIWARSMEIAEPAEYNIAA